MLEDYIKSYEVFSEKEGKDVISSIKDLSLWRAHTWHKYAGGTETHDNDFHVIYGNEIYDSHKELFNKINSWIGMGMSAYCQDIPDAQCNRSSIFRLNRFNPGCSMNSHWDRISDIFDGDLKGCPIFSIAGIINDDYEGGEFIFELGDKQLSLKHEAGTIMCFPSSYPWRHYVNDVKEGTRYSFVCWAF